MWREGLRRWTVFAAAAVALVPATAHAATATPSSPAGAVLWQFIRASGLVAYVLLTISVVLGLAVRTRALDALMRRAWTYEGHQFISLLAAAFTGLHVALLLANRHVPFGLADVLVPLRSGWRPVPLALGIVSAYLMLAVLLSSHLRGRLGYRTWRAVHYGSFGAWGLAFMHGAAAGSDTGLAWVQYLYLAGGGAVAFLVAFRALAPPAKAAQRPAGPRRPRAAPDA